MILNFYLDLPCRPSPKGWYLGSSGGWSWIYTYIYLYIDTKETFFERFWRNLPKTCFSDFRSCDFIFKFFCTFLKNAPEYIDPSGHFVLYEVLCRFFFFNLQLGVLLEVLLVVGLKFLYKTYHGKINWKIRMIEMAEILIFLTFENRRKRVKEVYKSSICKLKNGERINNFDLLCEIYLAGKMQINC